MHKTTVHEEKPISCEVCGKVLKNERYLKDHMIGHSAGKRFSCELCGKTFRWPNGLLKHKKFHSDVMPFSCNVCDKSFKEKATLQNHKIIHNKNLYFKCEICARTFSFQSALNRHCIRVHKFKKESLIKSKQKEMWFKNIYLKMILLSAKIYFYVNNSSLGLLLCYCWNMNIFSDKNKAMKWKWIKLICTKNA